MHTIIIFFVNIIHQVHESLILVSTGADGGGVLFFQAGAPLIIENAKFWPVLATFGYFVTNLRTFWCPFHRPKKCGGAPKIDRYQV